MTWTVRSSIDRFQGLQLAEYLGIRPSYIDSTNVGGMSNILHVGCHGGLSRPVHVLLSRSSPMVQHSSRPAARVRSGRSTTRARRSASSFFAVRAAQPHRLLRHVAGLRTCTAMASTSEQLAEVAAARNGRSSTALLPHRALSIEDAVAPRWSRTRCAAATSAWSLMPGRVYPHDRRPRQGPQAPARLRWVIAEAFAPLHSRSSTADWLGHGCGQRLRHMAG